MEDGTAPPEVKTASCSTCGGDMGGTAGSHVFGVGQISARFPDLSTEKEYAQAAARADTAGKTDQEMLHYVLSMRENRYLVRQMCWVMSIQGLETYLLQPRDSADYDLLVEAIRPVRSPNDMDVVVGMRGPIAPPEVCNGLMIPIVFFDQIYSFDRETLIKAIPRPENASEEQFGRAAAGMLDQIVQLADNAGATDEHRIVNFLAMRYHAVYAKAAEMSERDFSLTGVEVRPSALGATRKVYDVIFTFTNRKTDVVEKYLVRVDATGKFPFLVTRLSPYFDR